MKNVVVVLLGLAVASALAGAPALEAIAEMTGTKAAPETVSWDLSAVNSDEDMAAMYAKYRAAFPLAGEQASNDDARFTAFRSNVEYIKTRNAQLTKYKLGITQFTDMTYEDFKKQYLGTTPSAEDIDAATPFWMTSLATSAGDDIPESADWTEFVGTPRDQGKCGSCWAFSSTNTLAGHTAMKTKEAHVDLSVQNVVDCVKGTDIETKCKGAEIDAGWKFMMKSGAVSEAEFPYLCGEGLNEACSESKCHEGKVVATVKNYTGAQGEVEMRTLVSKGPMQFMMFVTKDFMHYTTGVFMEDPECEGKDTVNHGMMAIGYGTDADGTKYWLIQNSWNTTWGVKGVAKVLRGANFCSTEKVGLAPTEL